MTRAVSPSWNLAVSLDEPEVDTDWPRPIASDDENASISIAPGWYSSRRDLVSWLHMTPEEVMTNTLEMSQRSGSASSALRIGLANASPTMTHMLTFCCTV